MRAAAKQVVVVVVAVVAVAVSSLGCTGAPASARAPARSSAGVPFSMEKLTERFTGAVREVRQVAGYTYVAVELTPADVRWTATLKKDVVVGDAVTVRAFGRADNFRSAKLDAVFPQLWFGIVTLTR